MDLTNLNPGSSNNVSFGLSPILNQFSKWALSHKHPLLDTYLVNLLTMVRNNQQKGKSISELAKLTINDTEMLISHIENFIDIDKTKLSQPKLVIYIPFYVIPQSYAKKVSPAILEQMAVVERIKKILPQRTYMQGDLTIYVVYTGDNKRLPHIALKDYLLQIDSNFKFKRTVLFSHIPLDFHLCHKIVDFYLIESFTGKVKFPKEFSTKVFHLDFMPFVTPIHLLLGDGIFIKKSIGRKNYDMLLKVAKQQHWQYKAEKFVTKDLIHLKIIDEKFLDNFEL